MAHNQQVLDGILDALCVRCEDWFIQELYDQTRNEISYVDRDEEEDSDSDVSLEPFTCYMWEIILDYLQMHVEDVNGNKLEPPQAGIVKDNADIDESCRILYNIKNYRTITYQYLVRLRWRSTNHIHLNAIPVILSKWYARKGKSRCPLYARKDLMMKNPLPIYTKQIVSLTGIADMNSSCVG